MRAAVAVFAAALAACRAGAVKVDDAIGGDVDEASGVASAGGGEFVVVDDHHGVYVVVRGKAPQKLATLRDLEGVCVAGGAIVVVAEESGAVSVVGRDGTVTPKGTLVVVDAAQTPGRKNKGWEGLAFLPAALAADRKDHLLAVHEDAPRSLHLFSWPGLAPEGFVALDEKLRGLLHDLSDVAVDPKSGELLLLSDESHRVARVQLSLVPAPALTLRGTLDVPLVSRKEKPEGVVVDDDGTVWIVTDGSGRLFPLPAQNAGP